MTDARSTLRNAREATIDALCAEFARENITLPELERRLTSAREAGSREELQALLADLDRPAEAVVTRPDPGGRMGAEPADATRTAPLPRHSHHSRPAGRLAFGVLGGTRRTGKWQVPRNMLSMAIMGGVELDFRDAVLLPGVTEINVFTFWGGIEIIVPPDIVLENHGMGVMGGFEEDAADREVTPPAGAPVLRITGVAIMAGVEILVRRPGEPKKRKNRKS